jgi:membrane-bound serine protease (ClpP class)
MLRGSGPDPRPTKLSRAPLAAVTVGLALIVLSGPVHASTDGGDAGDYVAVIEVSGLLDEVLVDFVGTQIDEAEDRDAVALVLQLNSSGAVVDDDRFAALLDRIDSADVPVDVWVGPSGSRATGEAADLLAASRVVGVSGGSRVEITPALLGGGSLGGEAAVGDKVSAGDAVDLGLVDNAAPTIGVFVYGQPPEYEGLPGVETRVSGGERQPVTPTQFGQLPLYAQLAHTVASPPVAYLLFLIGLSLIVFELFTAGVGVAGLVGAGCLVLGCYGLASLPTNPAAVALLLFAMFAFAVDVQTGVPRVWSLIGTASLTVGSVLLYDDLALSWITLLVAIGGVTLAMVGGMPAMVRTRFSTPTIGREWMVGEIGTAQGRIAPEGVVTVRDAPWRARTNRATPIDAAASVRVVSIDGLLLEVEPVDGGAREPRDGR